MLHQHNPCTYIIAMSGIAMILQLGICKQNMLCVSYGGSLCRLGSGELLCMVGGLRFRRRVENNMHISVLGCNWCLRTWLVLTCYG